MEDTLRRWDIFSHFTDEQLAQLAACATFVYYSDGATIVQEGEPSQEAYLIESGSVRIKRKTPYGPFSLAALLPGTLFGETAFVDRIPRSGSAVSSGDTELISLNPEALAALMEQDPRFKLALYWAFWKSLSSKLRQTNENLTQFFSETGKPPSTAAATPLEAAGEFHVDLASKRKLFQEQKLSNLEINFLTSLSKERKYGPNQVIFREGELGGEMYVVLEGRVMISKYIPGAGEDEPADDLVVELAQAGRHQVAEEFEQPQGGELVDVEDAVQDLARDGEDDGAARIRLGVGRARL
ncbi:MAG TPA: cyclic nucleotide-binding domain-containing protein, partial [Thermoanaerobaculia bacterium]|nr:cyclic nucleotide-binding domain-containing protein [Thermoanaerobaculia bacterium]